MNPQVFSHDFFNLGINIFLLPTQDDGLDGVLFEYGWKDMPLDVSVNVIFLFLFSLLLTIPCWRDSFNTFELVVCWLDAYIFLCSMWTNRHTVFPSLDGTHEIYESQIICSNKLKNI